VLREQQSANSHATRLRREKPHSLPLRGGRLPAAAL
jgi:hypothetical protein